jgi:hypothetical protein
MYKDERVVTGISKHCTIGTLIIFAGQTNLKLAVF